MVSPAMASDGRTLMGLSDNSNDKSLLGILPVILNISIGQGVAVNASIGNGGSSGTSNLSIVLNLSQGSVAIPSSGELLNLSSVGLSAQNGTQGAGAYPASNGGTGYSGDVNTGSLVNVTLAAIMQNVTGDPGQNLSWSDNSSDVSKKIAHDRITRLLEELGLVKVQVLSSGLDDADKAKLIDNNAKSVQWLESKDAGIQAGENISNVREGIAGTEPGMALIRSGLRIEAGLLTCEDMDARIADAVNTSSAVKAKARGPGVTVADRAWYMEKMAEYDGHTQNASLHVAEAREAFLMVSGTSGYDARYDEGVGELAVARGELDEAYTVLKEVFRRMAETGAV